MSEYKRLTGKKSDGARVVVTENGIGYVNPEFIQRADVNLQKAIDRLAELEDKLEAGTLVELPCKVMIERTIDDKGNFIKTKKAQAFNGRYGILYVDKQKCTLPLIDVCTEKPYNREAAEARLKELEGK